jgi:hypothetical protein
MHQKITERCIGSNIEIVEDSTPVIIDEVSLKCIVVEKHGEHEQNAEGSCKGDSYY